MPKALTDLGLIFCLNSKNNTYLYHMNNEILIKQIHESDICGTFIEIGAGQPIAQALFNIEGASKTIYKAESPYSQKHQRTLYPHAATFRSVSKEFIQGVIDAEMAIGHSELNHNTYLVSSFQIANKPGMITHGWIGLRYRGIEKYYHLTITHITERAHIISFIGKVGVRILSCKNDLEQFTTLFNKESATYSCIDIIVGGELDKNESYIKETLANLESGLEHPITINAKGELIRLEDLTRSKEELMIMKGSFNPIHNHHLEIIKTAEKQYPNAIPCFGISLDTYSKGHLDVNQLDLRIKMLNKLGYPVIIFSKGLFHSNVDYLRKHRHIENKIIFPTGSDTVNRFIRSSYNGFKTLAKTGENLDIAAFNIHFKNVEFPFIARPGLDAIPESKMVTHFKIMDSDSSSESSTLIRTLFQEGKFEEVKKIVPKEIYSDVLIYLEINYKLTK